MKNRAEVVIAGNTFTMTGEQDEEYMVKIAALVDRKITEIRNSGASMMQSITLAACDMADSYVQAVQSAEHLRGQIADYLDENKSISRELADAHAQITRLEKSTAERSEEINHLNQLKERIAALEKQVAGEDKRRARINELESQIAQSDMRVRAFQDDADKRNRRIKDLERMLAESESQHRDDMEEAEKRERLVRELRDKLSETDKQRRRVEELEHVLGETERQLNELRSRLSRVIK